MIDKLKNFIADAGAAWVLWFLIALSALSLAVMLDRLRAFWNERDDGGELANDLGRLLGKRDFEAARKRLRLAGSTAALIALAGLDEWANGVGAVREAMAAATGLHRARLERRLLFLGTVGNNAPFIGLLGTVIGVVEAFDQLGRTSVAGSAAALAPESVMSTTAEALVATAAGLVVAIPAVAMFNYFQGRLTAVLAGADTLGHVVLTRLSETTDGR